MDAKTLLIEIARCPNVRLALKDESHPCRRVPGVGVQDGGEGGHEVLHARLGEAEHLDGEELTQSVRPDGDVEGVHGEHHHVRRDGPS